MEQRAPLKGKRGFTRLRNAIRYSWEGWSAAWRDEEAFRQIAVLALIGVPVACWWGEQWEDTILLILPLAVCLVVELLNSAVENTVDRISLEEHPRSKKAKDMGSAAQCVAQIFLVAVWLSYLGRWLNK